MRHKFQRDYSTGKCKVCHHPSYHYEHGEGNSTSSSVDILSSTLNTISTFEAIETASTSIGTDFCSGIGSDFSGGGGGDSGGGGCSF